MCLMGLDGASIGILTDCLGDFTVFGSGGRKAVLSRNAMQIGVNPGQCGKHLVMLPPSLVEHGIEVAGRVGRFQRYALGRHSRDKAPEE